MPADHSTRRRLAATARAAVFNLLGHECVECGSTSNLEINHIFQRDWQPRKLSHYNRQRRYLREAQQGLLNVLCADCNKVYRPKPLSCLQELQEAATNNPF